MASPRPVFPKNLPAVIYPPWLDAAAQAAPEACQIKTSERLSNSTHSAGAWFSMNALNFIRLCGAVPDTNIVGRVSPTPPSAHRSLGDPGLGPTISTTDKMSHPKKDPEMARRRLAFAWAVLALAPAPASLPPEELRREDEAT